MAPTANHVYWRAGFGPAPGTVSTTATDGVAAYRLLAASSSAQPPLQQYPLAEIAALERGSEERQRINREGTLRLNQSVLERMAFGTAQLREKAVLFWMDHFACKTPLYPLREHYYNTLHAGALGTFADLLHAVAKAPAMLQFLNNQQNRKKAPNENFAREVMELFTLGRGHYTETDIKEAARAFTGWGFDDTGQFVFRSWQHDTGTKTFRGQTGTFGGEAILDALLADRQTARYLTQKLYRYYVGTTPPADRLEELSAAFYRSGYAIEPLIQSLVTEPWAQASQGLRIKSPAELLAGLMRTFGVRFADPGTAYFLQKLLGQVVLDPPSVAGWPEGRQWIDSSSMLLRLRLGEVLLLSGELGVAAKDDGDAQTTDSELLSQMAGQMGVAQLRGRLGKLQATADFATFARPFAGLSGDALLDALAQHLLPVPPTQGARAVIAQRARNLPPAWQGQTETFAYALLLVGLPEYQLC